MTKAGLNTKQADRTAQPTQNAASLHGMHRELLLAVGGGADVATQDEAQRAAGRDGFVSIQRAAGQQLGADGLAGQRVAIDLAGLVQLRGGVLHGQQASGGGSCVHSSAK